MDNFEEQLRLLHEKYPIVAHTNAGRLSSTIRKMKAEKDLGIPVNRRTGFAISAEFGEPANEMDELAWESFFTGLCDELKQRCPELHSSLFDDEDTNEQHL